MPSSTSTIGSRWRRSPAYLHDAGSRSRGGESLARDQKILQARETRKTKRDQNNSHSLAATLTFPIDAEPVHMNQREI
jgi:hypothetical protein